MCSVNTTMFSQYKRVPCLPAPEFMSNLTKMKFARIADIRENEFECVFENGFIAKSRHCFHILFYTRYAEDYHTFICIDKACGNIYLISYDEDHTEGSTYAIKRSKKYSCSEFVENIKEIEPFLPGITAMFKDISPDNWKNYLDITYEQPLVSHGLLVVNKRVCDVEFLYYSLKRNGEVLYCTCSKEEYEKWCFIRKGIIDDYLYFSKIMEIGKNISRKKCSGFIFNRKLFYAVDVLSRAIGNANFSKGHMDVIRIDRGLFLKIEQNIFNEEIETLFNEIKFFSNKNIVD